MRWDATPLPKAASVAGTDVSDDTMYSCTDRMDSDWDMRVQSRSPSFITHCDIAPVSLTHLPDDALHHILSYLPVGDKYAILMAIRGTEQPPRPLAGCRAARSYASACMPCYAYRPVHGRPLIPTASARCHRGRHHCRG